MSTPLLSINNIDYEKINIKEIKLEDEIKKYLIEYNKNNFLIEANTFFNTYTIKSFNNIKRVPIILANNNANHKLYIDFINYIYKKIKNHIKNISNELEVVHPIINNVLNLEFKEYQNSITKVYEIANDNKLLKINIDKLIDQSFKIIPIIYLYQIHISKNKLYFNFVIEECYVKFISTKINTLMPIDSILKIINNENIDKSNKNNSTKINNKESITYI
jgi:hypothetical protein